MKLLKAFSQLPLAFESFPATSEVALPSTRHLYPVGLIKILTPQVRFRKRRLFTIRFASILARLERKRFVFNVRFRGKVRPALYIVQVVATKDALVDLEIDTAFGEIVWI